jgi:hypothetical protein
MGSLDEYGIDDMDEDFVEFKPDVYQRASGVEMGNTKKTQGGRYVHEEDDYYGQDWAWDPDTEGRQ